MRLKKKSEQTIVVEIGAEWDGKEVKQQATSDLDREERKKNSHRV